MNELRHVAPGPPLLDGMGEGKEKLYGVQFSSVQLRVMTRRLRKSTQLVSTNLYYQCNRFGIDILYVIIIIRLG